MWRRFHGVEGVDQRQDGLAVPVCHACESDWAGGQVPVLISSEALGVQPRQKHKLRVSHRLFDVIVAPRSSKSTQQRDEGGGGQRRELRTD